MSLQTYNHTLSQHSPKNGSPSTRSRTDMRLIRLAMRDAIKRNLPKRLKSDWAAQWAVSEGSIYRQSVRIGAEHFFLWPKQGKVPANIKLTYHRNKPR